MSKALFFNALPDAQSSTGYDRNYNADDLSDFLSIVCDTGVVRANTVEADAQGLKVVSASGMTINVNAGKAVIKGKAFINDALESFVVQANGTTATRYDYVVIKFDNNVSARTISLELRTGTSARPTVSSLNREGKVYELMLAYIAVAPSASSISQSNITDTRGYNDAVENGGYKYGDLHGVCPWFSAVKGYDEYYDAIIQKHEDTRTLSSISATVVTELSSALYNERYSLIDVYTNGIKELKTAYTVTANGGYIVITFTAQKAVGSKITVIVSNFIDGEGMTTALAQYSQLLADVTAMKAAGEYTYVCNGVNDNILISNLVNAYLQGGTDYGSAKFNIVGAVGMSAPAVGTGATATPYGWFNFSTASNRYAVLDFSRAGQISPTITGGTYNVIFNASSDLHIVGANVIASNTATDTVLRVTNASNGVVKFENCRFWLTGHRDSMIGVKGTYTNCRGSVANTINNSYCFLPSSYGVVKIIGGEYYAYTGDANRQSAVVGQSGADAVCILYGVSAPTLARGGFYQTNSVLQWAGGGVLSCTDLISALPMVVVSGISNIRGTITKSKTNVW